MNYGSTILFFERGTTILKRNNGGFTAEHKDAGSISLFHEIIHTFFYIF
jgi:hypothetical protein